MNCPPNWTGGLRCFPSAGDPSWTLGIPADAFKADDVATQIMLQANSSRGHSRGNVHERVTLELRPGVWGAFDLYFTMKQGAQRALIMPVWIRDFGNIKAQGVPKSSCASVLKIRTRKDGTILRASCFDNMMAIVTETTPDDSKRFVLSVVDLGTGESTSRMLPKQVSLVEHLLIEENKVVVVYQNGRERRRELTLVEAFTAHRRKDPFGATISKYIPFRQKQESLNEEKTEDVIYFDETFSLGMNNLTQLAFTQTLHHVTPSTLVAVNEELKSLVYVSPKLLTARRPLGLNSNVAESGSPGVASLDQDVPPYEPYLPFVPFAFYEPAFETGRHAVALEAVPSEFESTSIVRVKNDDGTSFEVAFKAAQGYDRLPSTFSMSSTMGSLTALGLGLMYVFYLLSKKSKGDGWA